MFRKSIILALVIFAAGAVNAFAQTETKPISKGVLNGAAISLPKPPYPSAAKAVGASGVVNVQVLIDEEGNVVSASAVTGHPLLRDASVQAAKSAKFKPTMLGGQAVKVSGVIVYNFVAPSLKEVGAANENADSESGKTEGNFAEAEQISTDGKPILNGQAEKLPAPVYPAAARAVKAEGIVSVKVTIDEEGNVIEAQAVSGHPLLRQASVEAAKSAKFKPTLLEEKPVRVEGVIIYNFVP